MAYEVTRDMPMLEVEIETPLETMRSRLIDGKKLVFVPILRAGTGLLDDLAEDVRAVLERPHLPLASILEGGTWAAGRELAGRLRNGEPPLRVSSDGTVF